MISRISRLKNRNFILGFVAGLVIVLCWPSASNENHNRDSAPSRRCPFKDASSDGRRHNMNGDDRAPSFNPPSSGSDFEPQLNLAQKPMSAKKETRNIIRPRYFSSELGIREKLFIGVMSGQDNIETLATAFNQTSAHLVDKIKFFINADDVKTTFKLKNIVGFTDTRETLRPFHILKYIADNYLDDFDYFLLVPDTSYVNSRSIREQLSHISIRFELYLGTAVAETKSSSATSAESGPTGVCDLDAGIILSSSVIKKIRTNLDWCVRNANSDSHSRNIGRCVKYSTKIEGCQSSWQGVSVGAYRLDDHHGIYRDFYRLTASARFNDASVVYSIKSADDFYRLHLYFSRLHLERTNNKLIELERKSHKISNGTIRDDILEVRWPIGVPPESVPETRYDLPVWTAMNLTHSFNYDAETNVQPLSKVDALDIEKILNRTLTAALTKSPALVFRNVQSIYRKFDPVRGMDYKLALRFFNRDTNRVNLIGYEVVKPLGMVEIIPSPYVTESTKVAILLPTFEHQIEEAQNFLTRYEKTCMANQDNTFLLLVFMYGAESPSKGDSDVFIRLKDAALEMSDKYKVDGSRIAWVSIRLPVEYTSDDGAQTDKAIQNSIYARHEVLSLAITDLALRKIGLDTLVLIASNSMQFKTDFLNRVRMNTIQGFQIFSPIGFQTYPCAWTGLCRECLTCDVGQHLGYFDRHNTDVISFYSRDYVEARKKLEVMVPIIRSDKDIPNLLLRSDNDITSVLDVFQRAKTSVHILRAVEPNLRLGEQMTNYLKREKRLPNCAARTENRNSCIRLASKKQFGDILIHLLGEAAR